jgi:hypothetical protein
MKLLTLGKCHTDRQAVAFEYDGDFAAIDGEYAQFRERHLKILRAWRDERQAVCEKIGGSGYWGQPARDILAAWEASNPSPGSPIEAFAAELERRGVRRVDVSVDSLTDDAL